MFEDKRTFSPDDAAVEVMNLCGATFAMARAKRRPIDPPFVAPTAKELAKYVEAVLKPRAIAKFFADEAMRIPAADFADCVREVQRLHEAHLRGEDAPSAGGVPVTPAVPVTPTATAVLPALPPAVTAPVAKVAPKSPAPPLLAKVDQNAQRRAEIAKAASAEMQTAFARGASTAIAKNQRAPLVKAARIVVIR